MSTQNLRIAYHKLTVLLVDPQRPFQIMMKGLLNDFGVKRVDCCGNGEAALRLSRDKHYQLLLVEYNLDQKNGNQLLEELRTLKLIKPDALFIIVTTEKDRAIILGTIEMAPDDYIIKPFSPQQLDNRIKKSWQKRQALMSIHEALAQHDLPAAIAACRALINNNSPYTILILQILSGLLCEQAQYQEAIAILKPLLAKRELPWASVNLARAELGLENIQEAEHILTKLLKKQANNVSAIDLLAQIQLQNTDQELAQITLQRSLLLSPHSMERHQLMVKIATQNNDYQSIKNSYRQLLHLSRNSVHQGVVNLLNYTRSIINNIAHCDEKKEVYKLQNELTSILHQSKKKEGQQLSFPYSVLEGVVQAQLHAAKGESLLSKKTLMNAIIPYVDEHDQWDIPSELAPDSCLTLINLNDFELALALAKNLDQTTDIGQELASTLRSDDIVQSKQQFHHITMQGIERYNNNDFLKALELFEQALALSPFNSSAVLNVIQAQIKLMLDKKKYVKLLSGECQNSFRILKGMKLPETHQERFNKLQLDYDTIINN